MEAPDGKTEQFVARLPRRRHRLGHKEHHHGYVRAAPELPGPHRHHGDYPGHSRHLPHDQVSREVHGEDAAHRQHHP